MQDDMMLLSGISDGHDHSFNITTRYSSSQASTHLVITRCALPSSQRSKSSIAGPIINAIPSSQKNTVISSPLVETAFPQTFNLNAGNISLTSSLIVFLLSLLRDALFRPC